MSRKKIEYPCNIRPLLAEEGGGYLIEFPDLSGCISDGETVEEALANGQDAVKSWLACARKNGDPIPKPSLSARDHKYNGKILQRIPKSLHAKIAQRAKLEGVSLNQLVLAMIAEGLGQRNASPMH